MKLTVIMSVYNGEKHLACAVESILNQSYTDFVFIAVNNGSTDQTGEILDSYSVRDDRMRVIHKKGPRTYAEGRMSAIEQVKTPWFAIMDADDIAELGRLKEQMEFLEKNSDTIGALGTWALSISENGTVLGNMAMKPTTLDEFQELYSTNEAVVPLDPSTIVHTETFFAVGGYRAEAAPAADIDLWYRIAETGKHILVLPKFLMRYRVHGGSDSVAKTMLQRKKTHFINYNMRERRAGRDELTWELFLRKKWADIGYKLPRLRNDFGLSCYKHAGFSFGERKWLPFVAYLLAAFAFKPAYVTVQLYRQQVKFRAFRKTR